MTTATSQTYNYSDLEFFKREEVKARALVDQSLDWCDAINPDNILFNLPTIWMREQGVLFQCPEALQPLIREAIVKNIQSIVLAAIDRQQYDLDLAREKYQEVEQYIRGGIS